MQQRTVLKKMQGRNQEGASAVEFAVVLPLLLVIVFGIVEFSLLLYNQQVLTNASREGARAGIVQDVPRPSVSAIEQVVRDYSAARLVTFATPKPSLIFDPPAVSCISFGDDLSVTVKYDYTFLVLPALTANKIPLVKRLIAKTVMKCE